MNPTFCSPNIRDPGVSSPPPSPLLHYVSVSQVTDAPLSHTSAKTKLRTESNTLTYGCSADNILPFKSYLTSYAREAIEIAESPVHMLIDIMSAEKNALLSSSEVANIQQYLSAYFVPDVVTSIGCYYNELASSWPIPQTYLAKYSLAQIGESVALELHALCSVFVPNTLTDMVGSSSSGQNVRGDGCGDEQAGIQGNQSGVGDQHVLWHNIQNDQSRGGRSGGRGGQGGRGGRGGQGSQGSQGGRGQCPMTLLCPEGQHFRNIQPTVISVNTFITPEKSQHSIVCQAARTFLLDPIVENLQSMAYDPYEEIHIDSENKTRMLFHGTCRSRLPRFQADGIDPDWRPNEMSSNRAFYLTNSIEQAVAHVLYMCPRLTALDVDPIIILVFSVDIAVLHGECPSHNPSVSFTNRWFEHDNPEHCQSFLEYAKYNLGLTLWQPLVPYDVQDVHIGPICLPTKPYMIILENWTQQEMYLTQVAACSKPAFDFFSNNLTQILEEKRVEKAGAA